jgi:hypothetical protein
VQGCGTIILVDERKGVRALSETRHALWLICLVALALAAYVLFIEPAFARDALADNGKDYSFLHSVDGSPPDNWHESCDRTRNQRGGVSRLWKNGRVADEVQDNAGGGCTSDIVDFNGDAHQECIGRYSNGVEFGCGPKVRHLR